MEDQTQKDTNFLNIYNKSYRLAAAVFVVSGIMDQNEELRTKIKKLSIDLVSMSVSLKDINFPDAKKLLANIEKISLELMSMLNIASVSGMISEMNGDILKEEFQSFIMEVDKFSKKIEGNKNISVSSIFSGPSLGNMENFSAILNSEYLEKGRVELKEADQKNIQNIETKNGNGHKRKNLRKSTIINFIKGHDNVSIKDIVPNIIGCSEKTVQRELIKLVNEGKIRKTGERRWSRYSAI